MGKVWQDASPVRPLIQRPLLPIGLGRRSITLGIGGVELDELQKREAGVHFVSNIQIFKTDAKVMIGCSAQEEGNASRFIGASYVLYIVLYKLVRKLAVVLLKKYLNHELQLACSRLPSIHCPCRNAGAAMKKVSGNKASATSPRRNFWNMC